MMSTHQLAVTYKNSLNNLYRALELKQRIKLIYTNLDHNIFNEFSLEYNTFLFIFLIALHIYILFIIITVAILYLISWYLFTI